jgi:hypothetical protein
MDVSVSSQESDVTMNGRERELLDESMFSQGSEAMVDDGPPSPHAPPPEVAPPLLPPVPGQIGLALCTPLTDERLASYRVPARTPDCGTNCISCTLLLLGWINRSIADSETDRCVLAVQGEAPHVSFDEVLEAVRRWNPFYYGRRVHIDMLNTTQVGVDAGTLQLVLTQVPPGYGCFFVYGGPSQTHVVVLRRLPDGTPELIDPQRGSAVLSRFTPSEAFRTQHGIVLEENYYAVRGEEHILATMVEQAALFEYFPTREEAAARMLFKVVTYITL